MKPMYCHDRHQCVRCGCTFHDSSLKQCRRRDEVLGIDETVYACTDLDRCALYKAYRDAELAREREDEDIVRAAAALGGKR